MPAHQFDPTATRIDKEWKHSSPLIGCRYDPTGRFLFVSAQDNSLQRFDLLTGAKTAFAQHTSWVRAMAFLPVPNPNLNTFLQQEASRSSANSIVGGVLAGLPSPKPVPFTLISADYHGQLIWWQGDAETPKPIRTVAAHDGWIRAVAVSPDGKLVATCGNDGLVKLWSASDGTPNRVLKGHDAHVYNVAFHPDGQHLASADLKGIVKDWDLRTGTCVRDLDAKVLYKYDTGFRADIGGARAMSFDSPGVRLACAGITNVSNAFAGVGNPLVVIFDWKDGKARQLKPKDAFQGTAWGVEFHPYGYVIAAGGGSGGRLWFWKGDELTSAHTVTVPANARDLTLHPSGTRVAVAGSNGTAYSYSLITAPKKK